MRALESADASACAAIHAACFAHPWQVSEFETMAASTTMFGLSSVDSDSGTMLGFIISRKVLDEAEVLTVAVAAEHRRRGVAAALLEDHLSTLAMEGVRRLFLEVDEGNSAARALYGRFGFVEKGRREGYYRKADGLRATALILQKDVI